MKKTDKTEFADFMLDEAGRYGRAMSMPEVETWYETFQRTTIADFKAAWHEHKRDDRDGKFFPKITDLQRRLRTTSQDEVARDWRCAEEVSGQHCGFPGGIKPQGSARYLCAAHYRLKGSDRYTEAASLQIIEQSRDYVVPKTPMEIMERGSQQRAAESERWRKRFNPAPATRKSEDSAPPLANAYAKVKEKSPDERAADEHVAHADAERVDMVNEALALAAHETVQ